jgi:hypothetical protein
MPANVRLGILPFVCAVVGPEPNPPRPSTRNPHRSEVSTDGEACVAVVLGIVLPPLVIPVDVELVVAVNVYPVVLSVVTVTASLWTVQAPPALGVTFAVTDPELLSVIVQEP